MYKTPTLSSSLTLFFRVFLAYLFSIGKTKRQTVKIQDEDESKTGEQGFPKDFERMSRKHRKMVAFEAVVHLLSDAQKREVCAAVNII